MSDLRKAAEDLLEGVEAAIKAGDWKVDGACDLDLAIVRLRQALAQPEQKPVAIVNEGMGGIEWLYKPLPDDTLLYAAPQKREWQGLTDEEREQATGWSVEHIESYLKEKNNG